MRQRAVHLGVEEDLRPEEALVSDINGELLLGDGVDARVLFDPLGAVCVVLAKLLNEVGAHVAEPLLKETKAAPNLGPYWKKHAGGTKK